MLQEFRSQKIIWDKAKTTFYEPVQASSGDSNGRKLIVKVLNNGVEENLTGATLSLSWHSKTDTNGLDAFTPIDISKGEFEIYYTTGMLSNFGKLSASLVLTDASGVIESLPFIITVHKSNVDAEAVQSDNSFTALTQALVQVGNLEAAYAPRLTAAEQNIVENHNQVTSHLAEKAKQADLHQTNMEVEGTNQRIDNLVIPISSENANIEVTDSHVSVVKNKTFPSLPKRLEEAEREFMEFSKGSPIVNVLKNASFSDTSNWISQRATLTAENNELKIDGNSEELFTEVYQIVKTVPHHWYYLAGFVKTTSDAVYLTVNNS